MESKASGRGAASCGAARTETVVAAAALLSLAVLWSGDAAAYGVNSHVAICDDIIDTLTVSEGVRIKPPPPDPGTCGLGDGPRWLRVPQAVRDVITSNPKFFRAGCVAPDGHVMPLLTDITHAEVFDPLGLALALLAEAKIPPEKAYIYGWLAHVTVDTAVHGFANHYAEGPFSLFKIADPSTWVYLVKHLRSEIHVQKHWIKTPQPAPELEVPVPFLRRMFLNLDGAGLRWLIRHRDRDPSALDNLQTGAVRVLEAFGQGDKYLADLTSTAEARAKSEDAAANAVQATNPWTWVLRPTYYLSSVKGYFFERVSASLRSALTDLRALQEEYLANNVNLIRGMVDGSLEILEALGSYATWLSEIPGRILALVGDSLFELLPEWVQSLSFDVWGTIKGWINEIFGVDVEAWVRARFAELKRWLLKKALKIAWSHVPYKEYLEKFASDVVNSVHPIDTTTIDADFEAAGITKDLPATGANRTCLRGYHFYRNARLLTIAGLSKPESLLGLKSLDETCEFRGTRFFQELDRGTYHNFVHNQGPDTSFSLPYCFYPHSPLAPLYDASRDWRTITVCEGGVEVVKKVPPSVCGSTSYQFPPCVPAAGKVFFVSDKRMPDACAGPGESENHEWTLWSLAAGASSPTQIKAQYHNHNVFGGLPVLGIGASPDGSKVGVIVKRTTADEQLDYQVAVMDADGSNFQDLYSSPTLVWGSPDFEATTSLSWSRDNSRIAFEVVGGPDNPNLGRLFVAGPSLTATEIAAAAGGFQWSGSGRDLIYYKKPDDTEDFRVHRYVFDTCAHAEPISPAEAPQLEWPFAVSRDGKVFVGLYSRDDFQSLPDKFAGVYGVRSEDGIQEGRFTLPIGLDVNFATWSPDGSRLAIAGFGAARPRIVLADFTGAAYPALGDPLSVTEVGLGMTPSFSPDGRYLAFAAHVNDQACGIGYRFAGISVLDLSTTPPTRIDLGVPSDYEHNLCTIPHNHAFQVYDSMPGYLRSLFVPRIFTWALTTGAPALFASFPSRKAEFPAPGFAPDFDVYQHTLSGGWVNFTSDMRAEGRTTSTDPFTRCSFPKLPSNEWHVVGAPR